jgi:hypothetical protein
MALDSYANLQIAIGNFLNRSDLAAAIPDFITLAEAQMLRRLAESWQSGRMLPRKMVAVTAVTINAEYANLPADFLGPVSFAIDSKAVQLSYLRPDSLTRAKAQRGANPAADVPGAYSIVGAQFQFIPVPDQLYGGSLTYWQRFSGLSGGNPSNWILADHPDLYLYGALLQSAPYLMDDGRIAMWANIFATGIEDLLSSDPLPNDGATLRSDDALILRRNSTAFFDIAKGE